MVGAPVTIVPISEDGSKRTHATWQHLVRRLARAVEPSCSTAPDVLRIESPSTSLGQAVRGSGIRQRRPAEAVIREIATLLRQGKFVFVHIDGDTPWSKRAASTAGTHFEERVATPVRRALSDALRASAGGGGRPHRRRSDPAPAGATPDIAASLDELTRRLRLVCPHYSVEAWLYQALDRAIEIARAEYGGRDVERLEAWRQDRAQVDEVDRLPDTICLGRHHGEELAAALTAATIQAVLDAGASLRACVDALATCAPLVEALRNTVTRPDEQAG